MRVSTRRGWLPGALVAITVTLAACTPVQQVQVNSQDTTQPVLSFGSTKLLPEFGVGASIPQSNPVTPSRVEAVTTFPEQSGFDGRTPNPEAVVFIKASDSESGIRYIQVTGQVTVWCSAGWKSPTPATLRPRPLPPVVVGEPNPMADTGTSQPVERIASVILRHTDLRAVCADEVVTDFEITLEAVSRNGANLESRESARIVRPVNVVVLNMWAPCLQELEAEGDRNLNGRVLCDKLHPQQPGVGPGQATHLNEQLDRWGRYFARQDIVLLNEATKSTWIDRIRLNMPDHVLAYRKSVAILSRWPLANVSELSTEPVCVINDPADGKSVCGFAAVYSEYVRATAATPRGDMNVMSLHWQHRPSPVTSHPNRVAFARGIVGSLRTSNWALVGGDFNSKSVWIASQDELYDDTDRRNHASLGGRSQPEIAEMESAFLNARREVWEKDPTHWSHSSPWPGDFLFFRNNLNAVLYTNETGVYGTDHPTIRVTLLRR